MDQDLQLPASSGLRTSVEVEDTSTPWFSPGHEGGWIDLEPFPQQPASRPLSPPYASSYFNPYHSEQRPPQMQPNEESLRRSMSAASARSYISPMHSQPPSPNPQAALFLPLPNDQLPNDHYVELSCIQSYGSEPLDSNESWSPEASANPETHKRRISEADSTSHRQDKMKTELDEMEGRNKERTYREKKRRRRKRENDT